MSFKVFYKPKNKGLSALVVDEDNSIGLYGTGGFIVAYFHAKDHLLDDYNKIRDAMDACSDRLHDPDNIRKYINHIGVNVLRAPVLMDTHTGSYRYDSSKTIDKLVPTYFDEEIPEQRLINSLKKDSAKLKKLPKYVREFDIGVVNEDH